MIPQFKGFVGYNDLEFEVLWENAIFVVDTNILINFYKYTTKESTKSLLDILKKLKESNRLWIPHQVALEYFFNYEDNMFKQKEGYDFLGKELEKLKEEARKTLSRVKSKHPYIMTEDFDLIIDSIEQSNNKLHQKIENEVNSLPDSLDIKEDILKLLEGIVGEPYNQKRIDEIEKEGKVRYEYNVPPGFKDKSETKLNYRTYGDFRYQQLYGDLIVWFQIIDRAKNEKSPTPIILITEDRKEDWWEKENGKLKRPQPQLLQEFLNKTSQNFYMYRTDEFIRNAMKYLGADVSPEQAEEFTKEVEQIRKLEEEYSKANLELDKEFMEEINNNIKYDLRNHININKLIEIMPKDVKEQFDKRVSLAFSVDSTPETSRTKYNHALQWAVKLSIDPLERKIRDLLGKIALEDYNTAEDYIELMKSLPNSTTERGMALISLIEELERELVSIQIKNGALPF
ncbi:PIN-like domain-containing protein (plasmid) [Cytobacillus spongiae]|uniref:PIN-like domain-containing protein n=1 Tax=Cytobacillus spongiae TaxID=2901381 RepID=UPI001F302399|nr:PIN-like domain-containing protein [Cytobacillus spongiae]UII58153.1 PIN-like domain-containing protein [Cytobacillus spongiae]